MLLLQVANIILSTQLLGSEGRGQISLYLLHIAIGAQIGSMVGGEALVFFAPRYNLKSIFSISIQWNVLLAVLSFATFLFFDFSMLLAFLLATAILAQSSFQLLTQVGMGNLLITKTNKSFLTSQIVFTISILMLYWTNALSAETFIAAFVTGLILAIITLIISASDLKKNKHLPSLTLTRALANGFVIQLGNVAQTFNSRLSFFLLEFFFANGKSMIGVYSTALMVSEKALVVPKSLGRVQYAETANLSSDLALRTTQYFKLYLVLAFLVMLILLAVPDVLYTWIFGQGFENVGFLIRVLIPAMLLLMGSTAMSNYFGGLGKYGVNCICTLVALFISSPIAFFTIPIYGNIGAAISTSIAFGVLCVIQCWYFTKTKKDLPRNWIIPNKTDWTNLLKALRKVK